MAYLVLARKWRPLTFDDLTGQESIARILRNAITQNKVAHAYIFSGPRGVGKTTTARILAKALNCAHGPTQEPCGKCEACSAISDGSSMDVLEIDGASNTGVDNIRDLRERVRYAPSGGNYKVYIIDEAHMLSTSAFNALLKTLEEPPAHVIFVLATTEPKKIPATVLSRCQHLPFRRITGQKVKERLKFISTAEKISISDSALEMIARAADGSMRDALTILDQIASFSEVITESEIKDLLGITDTETLSNLAQAVIQGDRKEIISIISALSDTGTDLKTFTKDFLQFMRDLLITKISGTPEGVLELSEEERAAVESLKETSSEEHLALLLTELIKAEPWIRGAFYPRVALEMTLIRLSLLSHFGSIGDALDYLQKNPGREGKAHSAQSKPSAAPSTPAQSTRTETKRPAQAVQAEKPARKVAATPLPDAWDMLLNKVDEINQPLASKLKEGAPSFGDKKVALVFNGGLSVHAESVKESIALLRKVLHDITGTDVAIEVGTTEGSSVTRRELKEQALQNPLIQDALELFEGRIVDVYPLDTNTQEHP